MANADLVIVGAGAAGLMAACAAAERGMRALLVDRKHRPGRKLLLCGNNRCNVTIDLPPDRILADYGEPVGPFLETAITRFPPRALQNWFRQHKLQTTVKADKRMYPRSEKADDVLHCFMDVLRLKQAPLLLNTAVKRVKAAGDGFCLESDKLQIESRFVLLATGGVSYPKTGSVGDGQKFARELGHKIVPYRGGLVGLEVSDRWLCGRGTAFPDVELQVVVDRQVRARFRGSIEGEKWGISGTAVVNATRWAARQGCRQYDVVVDFCPGMDTDEAASELLKRSRRAGRGIPDVVSDWLVPRPLSKEFSAHVLGKWTESDIKTGNQAVAREMARRFKRWRLGLLKPRPLKEAMVTVGGVSLTEVDAATMESRPCRGLFFAGEVLDIDGPTGGYNLQAAFATAQLAVESMARRLGASAR